MIAMENISRSFGTTRAVDELSFAAEPGEIYGLLGPNGAGKTTAIRIIMRILAPDSGTVKFDGHPLAPEDTERIGYLPEERGLYKKVKAGDMLRYLGELKGMSRRASEREVETRLEQFGMTKWKNHKIGELSKGMGQKIQFIGAVLHDPDVLILDEPFSGLDPVSTDTLREAILDLRGRGKTIFFSTHVMTQAEQLCDRILLVNQGKALVEGSLEDIRSAYGSGTVSFEFEEPIDESLLEGLDIRNRAPRSIEIGVHSAGYSDPQQLLAYFAEHGRIRRFEVARPSLHSVFIDLVKGGSRDA